MVRIFMTGSTDGLGRAAARALVDAGHRVVPHARTEDRTSAINDLSSVGAGVVIGAGWRGIQRAHNQAAGGMMLRREKAGPGEAAGAMSRDFSPLRRVLLASILGSAVLPRLAFAQQNRPDTHERTAMKIRMTFNGQSMTAALEDSPSSRDLVSMLPLDLTIDDYAHNEKIAYLPRKLTDEGSGRFGNEAAGDLCYFAPWGNLALFHAGYRYSQGLIRLGRIDGSYEPLLTRGTFALHIERIP